MGSRGTFAVLTKGNELGEEKIQNELKMLRERTLKVEIDGNLIEANGSGSANRAWLKHIGDMLNETNGILVNSWLELKALQTDLGWKGHNYGVGYYGVDSSTMMKNDSDKFRRLVELQVILLCKPEELSQVRTKQCSAGRLKIQI